jgi:hypothetical protein
MTPPTPASTLLSPRILFITGSLGLLLALALSPHVRAMLGIFDLGRWFLDSHAVLYAGDAARLGLDPNAPKPDDAFLQVHHYSDWWFGLGKLGLTRKDNFLVGGGWVLLFLLASVGSQLHRGIFHVEPEIYTMGGRIWLLDLGLAERPAVIASIVLLGSAAVMVASRGWTTGLARPEDDPEVRVAMTMAGALLIFCFLGAINFGYRWIFALWLAPWLWHPGANASRPGSQSGCYRSSCGMTRLSVWQPVFGSPV